MWQYVYFSLHCWICKCSVLPKQMAEGIPQANFRQRGKKAAFTARWLGGSAFSLVRAPPGTGHPSVTPAYPQSFCCVVECQAGRRLGRAPPPRLTVPLSGFSLKKGDLTTDSKSLILQMRELSYWNSQKKGGWGGLKVLVDNNAKAWLEVVVEQGGGPTPGAQVTQKVTNFHAGNSSWQHLQEKVGRPDSEEVTKSWHLWPRQRSLISCAHICSLIKLLY